MDKWIKCKDKLPTIGRLCYWHLANGDWAASEFVGSFETTPTYKGIEITHWRLIEYPGKPEPEESELVKYIITMGKSLRERGLSFHFSDFLQTVRQYERNHSK